MIHMGPNMSLGVVTIEYIVGHVYIFHILFWSFTIFWNEEQVLPSKRWGRKEKVHSGQMLDYYRQLAYFPYFFTLL